MKKEKRYKLIATRKKDEVLTYKFTREQLEDVIESVMGTYPEVILITKE